MTEKRSRGVVPDRWLEQSRVRAAEELAWRTERLQLGRSLLAPWAPVRFLKALGRLARGNITKRSDRSLAPIYPDGRSDAGARHDRERAETRALWEQIFATKRTPAYRLGAKAVALRKKPWKLPLLPVHWVEHAFKASRYQVRDLPPMLDAVPRAAPRPRKEPADWACLAPAWLEEMLALEGVPALERAKAPGPVLVCDAGRAAALPASTSYVCWLHDRPPPGSEPLLERAQAVYFTDAALAGEWAARLRRRVEHLPFGVQPLLHNPIDWWSGGRGIAGREEAELPPALARLVAVARGQALAPDELAAVEDHIGAPLPAPAAPAWAGPHEAADWPRLARMRRIFESETLRHRLERIGAAAVDPPLVSLIAPTMRPHHLEHLLGSAACQTHRPLELVLTLHGPQFDVDEVRARVRDLPLPVRIVPGPEHWCLGECIQAACDESEGALLCRMDDDNWYGPRFVQDLVAAFAFSGAGVVGKAAHLVEFKRNGRLYFCQPGIEYQFGGKLGGGRMGLRREVLSEVTWRKVQVGEDTAFVEDCLSLSIPVLATDRFHFTRQRGKTREHTYYDPERIYRRHPNAVLLPSTAVRTDFQP